MQLNDIYKHIPGCHKLQQTKFRWVSGRGECLSWGQGCPRALLMRERMGKGVKSVSWEGAGSVSPSQHKHEPSEELYPPEAVGFAGRFGTTLHG